MNKTIKILLICLILTTTILAHESKKPLSVIIEVQGEAKCRRACTGEIIDVYQEMLLYKNDKVIVYDQSQVKLLTYQGQIYSLEENSETILTDYKISSIDPVSAEKKNDHNLEKFYKLFNRDSIKSKDKIAGKRGDEQVNPAVMLYNLMKDSSRQNDTASHCR